MFQLFCLIVLVILLLSLIKPRVIRVFVGLMLLVFILINASSIDMTGEPFGQLAYNQLILLNTKDVINKITLYQYVLIFIVAVFVFSISCFSYAIRKKYLKSRLIVVGAFIVSISITVYLFQPGKILNVNYVFATDILSNKGLRGYTQDNLSMESIYSKHGLKFDDYVLKDKIIATHSGKNVVIILLEGYEQEYLTGELNDKITPNLNKLSQKWNYIQNINGIHNKFLSFGARYQLLTGLPFSFFTHNNMFSEAKGETSLISFGHVFQKAGYNLLTLSVAPGFAGTELLFNTFGFDVLGGKKSDYSSDAIFTPWGAHDKDLFNLAKEQYTQLSQAGKPFVLNILTTDTHHPTGHVDARISKQFDNEGLQIIYQTDYLVGEFVAWLEKQENFKDTVLIIMPDHAGYLEQLKKLNYYEKSKGRSLFIITNGAVDKEKYSKFIYPYFPRFITDVANIKTNALYYGDLFFTEPLSEQETIFVTKNVWGVHNQKFDLQSNLDIKKEKAFNGSAKFIIQNGKDKPIVTDPIKKNEEIIYYKIPDGYVSLQDDRSGISMTLKNLEEGFAVTLKKHRIFSDRNETKMSNLTLSKEHIGEVFVNINKQPVSYFKSRGYVTNFIRINNLEYRQNRGINISYIDNNKIILKRFDTYASSDEAVAMLEFLKSTLKNGTFISLSIFDEGSHRLTKDMREELTLLGFPLLSTIKFKEPYLAVTNESGLIIEEKSNTETNIELYNFKEHSLNKKLNFLNNVTHISYGRGITILYTDNNSITGKTFDTFASKEESKKFFNDLNDYITRGVFVAMFVNDEGSGNLPSNIRNKLNNMGFNKLSTLGYREPYISYMADNVLIEHRGKENTTLYENLYFTSNGIKDIITDVNNVTGYLNIKSIGGFSSEKTPILYKQ